MRVVEQSRRWVKDRIPAFICKETNWWISRWIQANVLLCPHCRQEYRSLKKVWDHLDEWACEEPSPQCQTAFSSKFREQFPSAFSQSEPSPKTRLFESGYGKVAFAGGVLCITLACVLVFQMEEASKMQPTNLVAEAPAAESPVDEDSVPENQGAIRQENPLIASAPPVNGGAQPPSNVNRTQMNREPDLIPPSERSTIDPNLLRTVSTAGGSGVSRSSTTDLKLIERHTVEINSHPVTGFMMLSSSTEDQAY